jgi:hypothetical protein
MEIEQKQINKIQQEGFDKETKLKIQAYLDEINQKQQQQKIPYNKTKYMQEMYYITSGRWLIQTTSLPGIDLRSVRRSNIWRSCGSKKETLVKTLPLDLC